MAQMFVNCFNVAIFIATLRHNFHGLTCRPMQVQSSLRVRVYTVYTIHVSISLETQEEEEEHKDRKEI